ncbi:hypothetical protein ABL78_7995 [Leptomonas seymouri]|uniref:Uncharacterized protein n=1 Tax=Leptomonas seymouri TaxID=5684 RepID=A0A0N0P2X0_LEPSE|nr:hypothetical protein ABL78_7995 [Leptomonas seymouri]|eukprot:KPI82987.1 hypothetical protein ABL78_7995 [Leptomonas seymouri]
MPQCSESVLNSTGDGSMLCDSASMFSDFGHSDHAANGTFERQVSMSDTGSHVYSVDFLPMPDDTDEPPATEITSATPIVTPPMPHLSTVASSSPPKVKAAADAETKGGIDGASTCTPTRAFASPFDTSPAIARALKSNFKMGQNANSFSAQLVSPLSSVKSDTTLSFPTSAALRRLPTVQIGEAPGVRGRRTHHNRGNNSTSGSRSGARGKPRDSPCQHLHSAAATVFNIQRHEPFFPATLHQATSVMCRELPTVSRPPNAASASGRSRAKRGTSLPREHDTAHGSAQQQAAQHEAHLFSPRRISSAGNQMALSMDGIVMRPSQACSANAMEAVMPPCVSKPREQSRQTASSGPQSIQSSANSGVSGDTVNRAS